MFYFRDSPTDISTDYIQYMGKNIWTPMSPVGLCSAAVFHNSVLVPLFQLREIVMQHKKIFLDNWLPSTFWKQSGNEPPGTEGNL